jgi:hypothetical protein
MNPILLLLLTSVPAPEPAQITIDPQPGKTFSIVLSGPSAAGAGDFRGRASLNGSASQLPLAGKAEAGGRTLRIVATARYADVPSDWLARFRPGSLEYAIQGEVSGGGSVSWSGTMPWSGVGVTGNDLLSRFLKLGSYELTSLSEKRTEGRAVLNVTNPFSFSIPLAGASFRVRVNGQDIGDAVGGGGTARARKTIGYEMVFTSEKKRFEAAAGERWSVGAEVPAELAGSLTLRLPSGEVAVPLSFSLPMGTNGARYGVFSYPPGSTSMSPR